MIVRLLLQKCAWVPLAVLLVGPGAVLAQPGTPAPPTATNAPGRVVGSVVQAGSGKPVEFATVVVLRADADRAVVGGACDAQGQFVLGGVPAGTYRLRVSYVGYETRLLDSVRIAGGAVALPAIALKASAQQLDEVQVTAERQLVETKVDRLVYNAEKDLTNAGGTAADVLQKTPLLSVDINGTPQLSGSANLLVLINGKPSTLLANNVADALRQIPADQIKSVEVYTSPPAKYDAEGSAGVINLVLKAERLQGVNGAMRSSASTRGGVLGGNVTRRRGAVGLTADIGSNWFYNVARSLTTRTDFRPTGGTSTLKQGGDFTNLGGGAYGQVGGEYDLTPKDLLTLSVRASGDQNTRDQEQSTTFRTPELIDDYHRDILTKTRSENLNVNFGYTKTLPRPGQELSVLALYAVRRGHEDYDLDQQREGRGLDYRETSFNNDRNREATLQVDYVHPLDSTRTLETGAKSILRRAGSAYLIRADSLDGRGFVGVPSRSNEFRYDQDVYAGYATYGFGLGKKFTFKLGGRAEYTRVDGDFITDDVRVQRRYLNVVPNLLGAWDAGQGRKLRLSYTRRIARPSIGYLNPYLNTSDRRNLQSGNPLVDAELTNAYELGYNTFVNKSTVNLSAYWRQTNNSIENISRLVPGNEVLPTADTSRVLYTTIRNLARSAAYGGSVFGSTKLTPKWSINGTVDVYYLVVSSPELGLKNNGLRYLANLNSAWQFPKGWSAQFVGTFNGRGVELQGRSPGYRQYQLGARKELFGKKGSLTMTVVNPFQAELVFRDNLRSARFEYANYSYFDNRTLRVTFTYRFGKVDTRPSRPQRSIQNDDQKG